MPEPEMFLKEVSQVKFTVMCQQEIEWTITVINKGKHQWPDTVELRCIDGVFSGKIVKL